MITLAKWLVLYLCERFLLWVQNIYQLFFFYVLYLCFSKFLQINLNSGSPGGISDLTILLALLRNLLGMQNLWPDHRPTESVTLGTGPEICIVTNPLEILLHAKLEVTKLEKLSTESDCSLMNWFIWCFLQNCFLKMPLSFIENVIYTLCSGVGGDSVRT